MSVVDFKADMRIVDADRKVLREFSSALGGDPAALAQRLGVKVYETPMDESVDGYIEYDVDCGSSSGYKVILNQRISVARKKFTLAHELGHFVLHRSSEAFRQSKINSAQVFDFPAAYRSADSWDNAGLTSWMEREADQFAACVLLPLGPMRRTPEFSNGQPAALAKRLGLSVAYVTRRFEEAF